MRFLAIWTLLAETVISIKFLKDAGNIQYVSTPGYIMYPWIIAILGSVSYWIYLRLNRKVGLNKVRME